MSNGGDQRRCCLLNICCPPPPPLAPDATPEERQRHADAVGRWQAKRRRALESLLADFGTDLTAAADFLLDNGLIRSRADDPHFLADAQMALDNGLLQGAEVE